MQIYTMMDAAEIYALFEARRKELGLSQADVGLLAFDKADNAALQNIKKGSSPSIERVSAIARALGLDLYLGEQREVAELAAIRQEYSEEAVIARIMARFGPNTTVAELRDALGLGEGTAGEMMARFAREAAEKIAFKGIDFTIVPLHEAWLSAGAGHANGGANIIQHLAFRSDWLGRAATDPTKCCLARVAGDSMFPTLCPGDVVLLDTAKNVIPTKLTDKRDTRRPPIWAFIDKGEARVKRIHRPNAATMLLLSDNPDYPPEVRDGQQVGDLQIIGKVLWWGHEDKLRPF